MAELPAAPPPRIPANLVVAAANVPANSNSNVNVNGGAAASSRTGRVGLNPPWTAIRGEFGEFRPLQQLQQQQQPPPHHEDNRHVQQQKQRQTQIQQQDHHQYQPQQRQQYQQQQQCPQHKQYEQQQQEYRLQQQNRQYAYTQQQHRHAQQHEPQLQQQQQHVSSRTSRSTSGGRHVSFGQQLVINTHSSSNASQSQQHHPSPVSAPPRQAYAPFNVQYPMNPTQPPTPQTPQNPSEQALRERVVSLLASTANGCILEIGHPTIIEEHKRLSAEVARLNEAYRSLKREYDSVHHDRARLAQILLAKENESNHTERSLNDRIVRLGNEVDMLTDQRNILLQQACGSEFSAAYKILEDKYHYVLKALEGYQAPVSIHNQNQNEQRESDLSRTRPKPMVNGSHADNVVDLTISREGSPSTDHTIQPIQSKKPTLNLTSISQFVQGNSTNRVPTVDNGNGASSITSQETATAPLGTAHTPSQQKLSRTASDPALTKTSLEALPTIQGFSRLGLSSSSDSSANMPASVKQQRTRPVAMQAIEISRRYDASSSQVQASSSTPIQASPPRTPGITESFVAAVLQDHSGSQMHTKDIAVLRSTASDRVTPTPISAQKRKAASLDESRRVSLVSPAPALVPAPAPVRAPETPTTTRNENKRRRSIPIPDDSASESQPREETPNSAASTPNVSTPKDAPLMTTAMQVDADGGGDVKVAGPGTVTVVEIGTETEDVVMAAITDNRNGMGIKEIMRNSEMLGKVEMTVTAFVPVPTKAGDEEEQELKPEGVENEQEDDGEEYEEYGDLTDDECGDGDGSSSRTKRDVLDCLSSIFCEDEHETMRFCHLCNARLEKSGNSDPRPTFTECSIRELIFHGKNEHPAVWVKLRQLTS